MAGKEDTGEVLKWYTRCFMCSNKLRCREEKVERGSKKCINLLKLKHKAKH
ncbi:MAG: hypothetical protein SA339_07725 [Methanomassiliicoccus sp.]|nr:hypothetical protein [Methanomassiliicoccus sp.]